MLRFQTVALRGSVALASVLLAMPMAAQADNCPAPAEAAGGPSNAHTRYIEMHLQPAIIKQGDKPFSLAQRMQQYAVPGLSVAVIHNGKLEWARGWGVRDIASCAPVTPDTDFQAASISKVVTAMLALRMVEQGKIGLDRNINDALHTWKLPVDPKLAPNGVTLRQLLSHTAGIGVHGFNGYKPGDPLPTTVQILDGLPPSGTPPVRSVLPAGAQFEYSGGGYVITQLALADVGGARFAELAQREVLGPLGMKRSAFAMPPTPAVRANMALGHSNGSLIPGGYVVTPQLGPAGLWTTAGDLARLLLDLQASAAGKQGHRLSPAMTHTMMTPVKDNWGLGVAVYPQGTPRFMHDGVNPGFDSFMVAYTDKGDGVVALANGGDGRRLIGEIVRAIATDYGMIDIAVPATEEKTLSLAELSKAAGHFIGGDLDVMIEARPDGLYANAGAPVAERLITLSPTRFRAESLGVTVEYAADFSSMTMIEGAPPMKLVRVAEKPPASKGG
ncbi:serine hydrolase domain-containing protein [Luteibacter aegosomatissinici]|uniref:serine hydrolase domain-containing protein n=1 Tax=Luteibacter aegosomatissinici TaxID=2911539 RepID=UPI001FFA1B93|nr:serine hydrolase domain-containing protein [Luteibacter aegosomatissinici]UPG94322.1 beta-lactamase family protein [Luteibacter aegosomatissinici]